MQKAITGGRCMTAFNKKWDVEGKISDYDVVSLYPLAMSRLWTVEGKPQPFHNKSINEVYSSIPPSLQKYNTSENGIGAYVIEIEIVKVNKHYAFPQITKKTEDGNLNDDKGIDALHPLKMTVDNITLEGNPKPFKNKNINKIILSFLEIAVRIIYMIQRLFK